MGTTRETKEAQVADLTDKLKRAKAALVANFSGLNVAAVMDIRRAFRAAGVEYKVVKNTLMKRALAGRRARRSVLHSPARRPSRSSTTMRSGSSAKRPRSS
jgi:ribosomal protein L10